MLKLTDRDCWIFDMDGTLTLANHDFEAIRAALDLPSGQPILEALAQLPATEAQPRFARLFEIEREIAQTTQAQPGAGELLECLRMRDLSIGILTRNSKSIAHQMRTVRIFRARGNSQPRLLRSQARARWNFTAFAAVECNSRSGCNGG